MGPRQNACHGALLMMKILKKKFISCRKPLEILWYQKTTEKGEIISISQQFDATDFSINPLSDPEKTPFLSNSLTIPFLRAFVVFDVSFLYVFVCGSEKYIDNNEESFFIESLKIGSNLQFERKKSFVDVSSYLWRKCNNIKLKSHLNKIESQNVLRRLKGYKLLEFQSNLIWFCFFCLLNLQFKLLFT